MSHFYGVINGAARTAATRRGHKASGLTTTAASWSGAIQVDLYVDSEGRDCYCVTQIPWQGAGCSVPIAHGVIGECK